MSQISYSYEIIAVDAAARVMEVVYTSEGRAPFHIGARLPYDGETVEQIVAMYAPIGNWIEAEATVVVPEAGTQGSMTYGASPTDPASIMDTYRRAIDAHVEAQAAAWNYNSAGTLATYIASTNPQWAAEAAAFVAWRDQVWVEALTLFASVQGGAPLPESPAAFIATLPALIHPSQTMT